MASIGIISNYSEIPRNIIKIDTEVHYENFNAEWRRLVLHFDKVRENVFMSDSKEETNKLISGVSYDLAELIHFNPSLVTVRTSTFGTSKNTYEHFIEHLSREIFTKKTVALLGNDINNALKYAELLYTDDSIIRFLPELVIKPNSVHEREICMFGSPKEILEWVFSFEKIHYLLIEKKKKADDLLDYLYIEKNNIIKIANELNMYLPIAPRTISSEDKNSLHDMITKNWCRNKRANPDIILEYLYLNEIENLRNIGLFIDD